MSRPGHLPIAGLWLLAAILIVRLTVNVMTAAGMPAHGFVGHYTASRLILTGADPQQLYVDSLFIAEVGTYEPGIIDIFGANPPTVGLTALPLAPLEYRTARLGWTLLSLLGWLSAIVWLARASDLRPVWVAALLCGATIYQPVIENLEHGQFHVLVLALVLAAWAGERHGRPKPIGLGLGTALGAKAAGLAFWPMLVARRQWRALAWGATTLFSFGMMSVLVVGPRAWTSFLERAGDTAAAGSLSVTAYQTVPGLIRRLTVMDAQWNPNPLFNWGAAGMTLSWLVPALLLGVSLVVAARTHDDRVFPAFAALTLVISPVSLDYHYVLAVFPIVVLLADHRDSWGGVASMLLISSIAMIALDLPFRSPRLADGALALLAYPKLYGGLILWWLALRRCLRSGQSVERMVSTV